MPSSLVVRNEKRVGRPGGGETKGTSVNGNLQSRLFSSVQFESSRAVSASQGVKHRSLVSHRFPTAPITSCRESLLSECIRRDTSKTAVHRVCSGVRRDTCNRTDRVFCVCHSWSSHSHSYSRSLCANSGDALRCILRLISISAERFLQRRQKETSRSWAM